MRVYYDRDGQVTGYSKGGWHRGMGVFWIIVFGVALLGWPLAVVPGWWAWPAEAAWLLACFLAFVLLRPGPGPNRAPPEGETRNRPGPGDTQPYGPLHGHGPRDWKPAR